ncbi:thioredoxin domain-containing protein [Sphingomonas sp.]|uniref:thioredoxin domain-containing protein n=1 Tax=Sphingomonas sp. TaxID=28214 RepID=UPI002DB61B7D|nr:thioredoxin domain-containing protein [Sphingomonas sp.]HEU4967506.1 thioredoxin domain-containing protein [Sphingomonas sp.]
MNPLKIAAAALGALALVAATAAVDWTHKVTQTPAGAFVLGNPAAKTRLVEYVSYTCPHCAHFTDEASAPLRKYVASGGTAVEIRHAVRDAVDLTATLLARCTGPAHFFAAHDKLFATQETWFEAAGRYIEANRDALEKAKQPQQLQMVAKAAGLGPIVGLTDAQVNACLANTAAEKPVIAMTEEAWQTRKIPGTPYFMINGTGVDATTSWAALEPHLKRN